MTGGGERTWIAAAALLACAALAVRVHSAFAYPALLDFDGAGHALNTFALLSGRLPDPRSWSGFHPPLAHAVGALVWRFGPESIPVHVLLRLCSAAAGALAVGLIARVLWGRLPRIDAALVSLLALSAPVTAVASSMIGNEMLCTLLVTACLASLLPDARDAPLRRAAVTGLLGGAAALAKSTGLVALAAAAVGTAVRWRHEPRRLLAVLAVLCGVGGALVSPHALRLLRAPGGSPLAVISGGVGSPDARAAMAAQPPGERRLAHYLRVPAATLVAPFYLSPGMLESVPGLLYASTWADAHAQFLPPGVDPAILRAESAVALGGLLPTALALVGLIRVARRKHLRAGWLGPFAFAALLAAAFCIQTWTFPHYSAVKASYLLPAALPACYALGVGLGALDGAWLRAARLWLLGLAAASSALTAYGWWS